MISRNFPAEMARLPYWVAFSVSDEGKKTPVSANGGLANIKDPSTWTGFEAAAAFCERKGYYLGFACTPETGFVLVDIDHLDDIADAIEIVAKFDSYTEVSQSGRGVHVICRGLADPNGRKQAKAGGLDLALYQKRFVCLTGDTSYYSISEVREAQEAVDWLQELLGKEAASAPKVEWASEPKYDLDAVIAKMQADPAWDAWLKGLWEGSIDGYPSHSEADLALCRNLAFWADGDAATIDALFCLSGLYRDKWQGSYRENTVAAALKSYEAKRLKDMEMDFADSTTETGQRAPTLEEILYALQNDYSAAECYNRLYPDTLQWRAGEWLAYNKEKGVWDASLSGKSGKVKALIAKMGRSFHTAALKIAKPLGLEPDEAKEWEDLKKSALKASKELGNSRKASGIESMLTAFAAATEPFDADGWALNCPNGVLDLRTGELKEHSPKLNITKLAGAAYEPEAKCPRWIEFLNEILEGDTETIAYLQRYLGLCLTGYTMAEKFLVLEGLTSRNGKSTLLDAMKKLLGDYAMTARRELLMSGSASRDVAAHTLSSLEGARLAIVNEWGEYDRLDTATVKEISGGTMVSVRKLYGEPRDMRPCFKLILSTNYSLSTSDNTIITSDRLDIIPFRRSFAPEERDEHLGEKLEAELSGILNWCMEGLHALIEANMKLGSSQSMQTAKAAYAHDVDLVGQFLEERMDKSDGAFTPLSEILGPLNLWLKQISPSASSLSLKSLGRKISAKPELQTERKRLDGSPNKTTGLIGYKLRL
jgi:putative DNA primase/helicase